ncbi:MAG: ABC transporter permease [Oscillospiraceae bacterium]|nr:ABC transporter permease [Oscillospiraceae bacterium]
MNILTRFTAKAMKQTPGRTLVTLLGVILSAVMFTAVTTFAFSLWTFLRDGAVARTGDYYIRCDWLSPEEVTSLEGNGKVKQSACYHALGYLKTQEDKDDPLSTFTVAAADSTYFASMPVRLSAGRVPENSGELLLHESILTVLEDYGLDTALGSRLSMELLRYCEAYPYHSELSRKEELSYEAEYTVVGYLQEDMLLVNNGLDTYPMLTLADGEEGTPLWTRMYVKTAPGKVWEMIRGAEFHDIDVNESLLALYGQSRYENFTGIIFWLAVVLCGIIVVGSVSLIYNSFSISLSERTKQFGLLSCIGATKKQIRRAVYTEALLLGIPGIPLGILFGYGGISLTLYLLRGRLTLIMGEFSDLVSLRCVFSPLPLLLGGLLALLTLLLSAAIPAKRATAITPLEAIRQNREYRIPKSRGRTGHSPLFGLPGTLAKSYYRIGRGKYRATLISLIISLVLFLSAAGFTAGLKQTADEAINVQNYDFACSVDRQEGERLASLEFVDRSAFVTKEYFLAQISREDRSEEFLKYQEELGKAYAQAVEPVAGVQIYYLEDAVLQDYLISQGLEPEEYLRKDQPKALVCYKEVITYAMKTPDGLYERYTYHYAPFRESASELYLFPDAAPAGLQPFGQGIMHSYGYTVDTEGNLLLGLTPHVTNESGFVAEDPTGTLYYRVQWTEGTGGRVKADYYLVDQVTGRPAQTSSCTELLDLQIYALGATIRELPFGIAQSAKDSPYYTALILPLSVASPELAQQGELCFKASDYDGAGEYFKGEGSQISYIDYREQEEAARAMVLVVDIFSYGFIVLICMICIANIFNTLSTNVALRRRDFGMLRSIGFRNRDLGKMLSYECLTYGTKALLWGLPLGLLCNAGIQKIAADSGTISYVFPTRAVLPAVISIFAIVFSTIFYAAHKLRKDNPIEAIRQECI